MMNIHEFHGSRRWLAVLRAGIVVLLLLQCSPHTVAEARHLDVNELVVVVLSQNDDFSSQHAEQLLNNLRQQTSEKEKPVVHFLHSEFVKEPGAWTVVPILPRLLARHGHNATWFFICEPRTRINLAHLTQLLGELDPKTPSWLGHALYDREPTIIHHFALLDQVKQKFKYPNFAAGFAINIGLLKKLVSRLNNGDWPQPDFSIDVSHELSMFIWDDGGGVSLNHSKLICLKYADNCASYPVPFTPCGDPVDIESIFFAVKTCSKFHKTRLPVVMQTWAPHTHHITLFSDVADPSIPYLVDLGVPNTEQGHCHKTMTIVRHVAEEFKKHPELKWLVLADDDTIFSVARLQELLSCYGSTEDKPLLALGERYGYRARENHGYSYITGGGGTVLSRHAVLALAAPGACNCPAPTAPDDMFMGLCFSSLNIPIIHSPFFHQARPVDYAPEYLSSQHPVSFHKHWMIDPIKVYRKWFEAADSHIVPNKPKLNQHLEL